MPSARLITFKLYEGSSVIIEGKFTTTKTEGISCFGTYQDVPSASGIACPFFEGAIIEHKLETDGAVGMTLSVYAVRQTKENHLSAEQFRVLRAGISMGNESGETEADSVMLGNDHEFVFQTKIVA